MAKKHQLLRTHTLGAGWTLRPDGEADDRPGIHHWFVRAPCGGTASLRPAPARWGPRDRCTPRPTSH